MTRARAVVAVSVSLSVLALGACSGEDPEPRFAPPSSSAPTSPSTTAASGPTEPTMPDEARGTDAAAAEAFVRFYWEMVNYAQATGDVDGLRELSYENCAACQRGLEFLGSVYEKNGSILGGRNTVSALRSAPIGTDSDRRMVRFDLSNARQVVDLPGAADDKVYKGSTVHAEVVLHLIDGRWRVEYLGEQS